MAADTILRGGHLITMDPARPRAAAIGIRGDRIDSIGSDEAVLATADRDTEIIDLADATVVPGLIDSHTHLELTSYSRHFWHDVRGLTPVQVVEEIDRMTRSLPPGEWIILQGTFGQVLPDKAALDDVAPEHPVAVRWSMHKFQLNSCALALSAIDRRTVAPPGARIHFDADGGPSGLIEEGWDLLRWEPPLLAPLAAAITETARSLFLCHGITTLHEIAASPTGMAAYVRLAEGQATGDTPVIPRIGLALTVAPGHQPLARTVSQVTGTGLRSGFGGPYLRLAAMKVFVDGGRDGALRSKGINADGREWGLLTRTPQHLANEVSEAVSNGVQMWIHAIGDLAQEATVTAIEQASRAHPGADHRTRIEHFGNELYDGARLERLLLAGGIPAPNPSFVFAEPDEPERRLPPDVVKYGMRTLLDAGARPPGNSDTAGAQPFACNPWFTMHCMVNRLNRNDLAIDPGEAITVEEALRSFTVDAAAGCFLTAERGSLETGKLADLAVLNKDPLSIPATELATVTATRTLVGGRTGHLART